MIDTGDNSYSFSYKGFMKKNESMILVFTHKEDICFSSSCNPVTPFANYSG